MVTELLNQRTEILGKRRGFNPAVLCFMRLPLVVDANLFPRGR